jgi:hypothetical protein
MNGSSNRTVTPPFVEILMTCLALLIVGGCNNTDGEQLDASTQLIQVAFEAWQRGEKASSLQSGSPSVQFHDDDWERSARLVEFKIVKTYMETDDTPRCAVEFSVQYGKKPPESRQATYQLVKKGDMTVIARDPFS